MTAITHTYRFTGVGEDFGPRADGIVTLHTFEPTDPLKNRIVDAIAGAKWQDRDDVLGSYNRIVCVDGVLSTVPDNHASGGINPASKDWSPRAWLYDFLDRDEVANPNYFTLNLCAMGRRAHFDANGWPPQIIEGFARSILDEERRIGRGVVVTNHGDFQSNRSDAGAICMDLVMKRYQQLKAGLPDTSTEEPMPALKPVRQQWTTGTGDFLARDSFATPGGQFWTAGPGQGDRKWFTTPQTVWTIAETDDGLWRLVEYGSEVLWMHRYNLRPVDGTRNPAGGFGTPSLAGHTAAELAAATEAGRRAGFIDCKTQAVVKVQGLKP